MTAEEAKWCELLIQSISIDLMIELMRTPDVDQKYIRIGMSRGLYGYITKKVAETMSVYKTPKVKTFKGFPVLVVDGVEGFTAYIMRELPQVKKEGEKDGERHE